MNRKLALILCIVSSSMILFAQPTVILVADLFRAPNDPDDHFDLATNFALAKRGAINLKCVIIDYPPATTRGNPDVEAVAQLSFLTGVTPLVAVGQRQGTVTPSSGLLVLKRLLEESTEPVVIHILGANDTLALMSSLWPELLRKKVRAVYLNSGVGIDNGTLEYNVWLSPEAYRKMFSLPCPVYWLPCFHRFDIKEWEAGKTACGRFGSYWKLPHAQVFDAVRPNVLNYFLDILKTDCNKERLQTDSHWLNAITGPVDESARSMFYGEKRNMWCTIGFLHTAGLTVWKDGTIAARGEAPEKEIFRFRPVVVHCGKDARTTWEDAPNGKTHCRIVEILDPENYPAAMTKALVKLFSEL